MRVGYVMIVAILGAAGFSSCKKERATVDFGQGVGRCRISGFTEYTGNNDSFQGALSYDRYNRLERADFGVDRIDHLSIPGTQ